MYYACNIVLSHDDVIHQRDRYVSKKFTNTPSTVSKLVNHERPGVYAKVMVINQLNKLSNEMNIIRMNADFSSYQKIVTRTRSLFRNRTVHLSKVSD